MTKKQKALKPGVPSLETDNSINTICVSNLLQNTKLCWMKKDTIVTVLTFIIHHVTAKQAYQIRAVAERSLTTKKAPKEQAIISGTQLIWDNHTSALLCK